MPERRKHVRIRKRLRVRFGERDLDSAGVTTDVSTGGLFIESDYLPPVNARLHLELMKDERSRVYLEGRVRRHRSGPGALRPGERAGFGVRALELFEIIAELLPRTAQPHQPLRFVLEVSSKEELTRLLDEQVRRGGIFVPTERSAERLDGADIDIRLTFLGAPVSLPFKARVIHTITPGSRTDQEEGIGFELEEPEAALRALEAYLG